MAKPLSILVVSNELYPFIKTSELADAVYAHAMGLRDLGHDVRVMTPKYGFISERKNKIHEINRLRDIPIPVGKESHPATVKSSSVNNPRVKIQAYITTNANFLDAQKGVLYDNANGNEFDNNDDRFIFFNRTVLQTCVTLGWFPDIIHCFGWQSASMLAFARVLHPQEFKKSKLVFTITDFDRQGAFPSKSAAKLGLPLDSVEAAKHKTKFNLTRLGVAFADRVTTLSPHYATELKANKEFKSGWTNLLRGKALEGVSHGIDTHMWSPATDSFVKARFSAIDTAAKADAREALQRLAGLPVIDTAAIVSFIGPIDDSRGVDILAECVPMLVNHNAQVVICADHPWDHRKALEALAKKHPKSVVVRTLFDEDFLHHTVAGSTLLVKPSRSEAAGQYQRACLPYGTIPVVRSTGGTADGLTDIADAKGNAVLFTNATAADLEKALKRAFDAIAQHERWSAIVANAMSTNVSWLLSAKPYDAIYRNVMKEKE
jgi:starch synthase